MATSDTSKFCKKLLLDQQHQVESLQNACRRVKQDQTASPLALSVLEGMLPAIKNIIEAQKFVKIGCAHGVGVAVDYLEESSLLSLSEKEKKKLEEVLKKRKSVEQRSYSSGGPRRRYSVSESPSDICKSCGEIGHWWNNPICKNYSGPAKKEKN